MNKIRNYISIPVMTIILLGGCNKKDNEANPGEPQTIRFEMIFPTAGATGGAWTEGDQVGIYITGAGEELKSSGNWADNLRLTYKNGRWEYDNVYYPSKGAVDVYAYYPYVEGLKSPNGIILSIETDQSDKTGFDKNQILTATVKESQRGDDPVRLDFRHRLAMVELTVTGGGLGAAMSPLVTPTLRDLRATVNIDLSRDAVVPAGSTESITMYRLEQPGDTDYFTTYTYRAWVHEKNYSQGDDFISLTQGSTTMNHKTTAALSLNAGEVKPYGITLSAPTLQSHTYSVGDPYPYLGFPMGIVYQVTDGGLNGRIVSLDSSECAWSTEEINLSTDSNDGLANMQKVKDHDGSYGRYPAFRWVDAHNPEGTVYSSGAKNIWYLPSLNELHDLLMNVWKPSREELDQKMELAGGIPFPVINTTHWSSTELGVQDSFYQGFVAAGSWHKNENYHVRPIMDF